LGEVALLIVNADRAARFAEEPAVGAVGGYFPRFSRARGKGKHGDHDGDEFHGSVVRLANFSSAKTITAAQIMSQRVRDVNPLLIFMCAIRVKSGTGAIGRLREEARAEIDRLARADRRAGLAGPAEWDGVIRSRCLLSA
jgi:hypothetical protein